MRKSRKTDDNTMELRTKAVILKCEEMALWYAANAPVMRAPPTLNENRLSYDGKVVRWLEPPLRIPGNPDPVLLEFYKGDAWVLELVPMSDPAVKLG